MEPYDRWAAAQARRAFRDVPRRESQGARSGVIQLKRHPALREVLANIAGKLAHDDEGMPLPGAAGRRARRTDLHHLFGDRALMDRVAARAGETVVPAAVNDIVDHTRIQFTRTSEEIYGHLGAARLATLDGRAIDDGTPTEDAWTIDVEDYAVLFELDRLRAEGFGHKPAKLPRYDCLVVDEAQELAPLELALLGRSLDRGGTLIVAGDAGQQIDPAASFLGWESTMRDLSAGRYETATLQISYRCPEPVTEVARALRAPRGVAEVFSMPQGPISCARAEHELHLASWLVDELRRLRHLDPLASIALLCRTHEGAQTWARHLNHGLDVRLALEGRFDFKPGVTSTSVAEVKGLEFDYAILPDAAPASYPDLPEARRALYVAVTRATHRLVLATPGRWSPLLDVKDES